MVVESRKSSISGYLTVIEEERVSSTFTDIELYAKSGHSVLLRAKRYGQWWMLKGLGESVADIGVYYQMLKKEFDILIRMHHPGIVHASEMVSLEGEFAGSYIVMDWIDGVDWRQWAREPHSHQEKLNVVRQLFDAVAYIHSQGIVHRDLKPENIIITHNGNYLRIIDFGLSDSEFFSILKHPAGTEGYMSPEQQTRSVADVRNDIFSIGTLIEQLSPGRRYRPIIRKCKAPIDKRYPNLALLRYDFDSAGKVLWLPVAVTVILLLAAISGAYFMLSAPTAREEVPAVPESPAVIAPAGPVALPDPPTDSLPSAPSPAKVTQKTAKRSEANPVNDPSAALREAINQGIAAFEVEASKIDAKIDTLTRVEHLVGFGAPSKAWRDFYYGVANDFNLSPDEYNTLYLTLEQNSNIRYALWRERMKTLKQN